MRYSYPMNFRELCWELRHLIFNPDLPEEMAQERIEILPGVYAQATSKRRKYFVYACDGGTWADLGARGVYSLVNGLRRMRARVLI